MSVDILSRTAEEALHRYRAGSLLGWLSIGAWIITPQLWENYQLKSGEGLSVLFILIWTAGDLTGLLAATWQNLMPTLAVLAAYYMVCVLLGQVFWYRRRRRLHPELYVASDAAPRASSAWDDESAPLLANGKAASRTALWKRIARHAAPYLAGCAFIVSFGFLAWFATTRRQDRLHRHPQIPQEEWDTSAQVVGWISAALYLGSRIPQILKNRETHCAGLSLVMFFFSVIGNITYAASIFIPSLSVEHLYINSSFLAGSLGTMCVPMTVSRLGLIAGSFLDVVILYQFWSYRTVRKSMLVDASSEYGD